MKKSQKLVRDGIPDLMLQNGQTPHIRILDDTEYRKELENKLQEEVEEYLRDKNEEELADILEVLDAIIEENHFSWENILEIKRAKKESRGGFKKKIFLME